MPGRGTPQRHNVVPPLLPMMSATPNAYLRTCSMRWKPADQVGRHELHLVVLVVLVAAPERRVAGGVVVLEEVRRSNRGMSVLLYSRLNASSTKGLGGSSSSGFGFFFSSVPRPLPPHHQQQQRQPSASSLPGRAQPRPCPFAPPSRPERRTLRPQHLHRLRLLHHRVVQAVRVPVLLRQCLSSAPFRR
ncbi:hypothetical protein TcBrA4_0139460 [Trypanosoma cruzi]|nr:hypothetical protein TcBrA4_0139460 [Trypanosoma cruzi]